MRALDRPARGAGDDEAVRALNARIVLTLVLSLGYAVILIGWLPFWLATGLFVTPFTAVFAPSDATLARKAASAVVAGVLTSLVVTLVFERVFYVRLP